MLALLGLGLCINCQLECSAPDVEHKQYLHKLQLLANNSPSCNARSQLWSAGVAHARFKGLYQMLCAAGWSTHLISIPCSLAHNTVYPSKAFMNIPVMIAYLSTDGTLRASSASCLWLCLCAPVRGSAAASDSIRALVTYVVNNIKLPLGLWACQASGHRHLECKPPHCKP